VPFSLTVLVLDRVDSPIRPELDYVALADQSVPLAPYRKGVFQPCALMPGHMGSAIHSFMLGIAPGGMDVLLELAVEVDESATPRAIAVLVERGEVDGVVRDGRAHKPYVIIHFHLLNFPHHSNEALNDQRLA
jgi:hypothetical protein